MSERSRNTGHNEPRLYEVDISTMNPEVRLAALDLLSALGRLGAQVTPYYDIQGRAPIVPKWFTPELTGLPIPTLFPPDQTHETNTANVTIVETSEPATEKEYITFLPTSIKEAIDFKNRANKTYRVDPKSVFKVLQQYSDYMANKPYLEDIEHFPFRYFEDLEENLIIDADSILPAVRLIQERNLKKFRITHAGLMFLTDFAKYKRKSAQRGYAHLKTFQAADITPTGHTRPQAP